MKKIYLLLVLLSIACVTNAQCTAPTNLDASNITTTTANISWDIMTGITGFEYVFDQNAGNPAGAGTATSPTLTVFPQSGLTPGTAYYAHVRTNCGAGIFSPWTTTPYTTLSVPLCDTVLDLGVTGITDTSATFLWDPSLGAAGYEYQIDQSPANPSGAGTATASSVVSIDTLHALHQYYFHVRVDCGGGNFSQWVTIVFYTQQAGISCLPVSGLAITNITTTSGDINWNNSANYTWYEHVVDNVSSAPTGSGTATIVNTVTVTALTPNLYYYAHVRVNCGNGDYSQWMTVPFHTTPLGVNIVSSTSDFNILAYPNPATDIVTVKVKDMQANAILQLTDITGAVLQTITLNSKTGVVNMNNLAPGMYLIRYLDDAHSKTLRVGKQ